MLKTTLLTLTQPDNTKVNKNEFNIKSGSDDVDGSRIDDKIAKLLNSIKVKKSFRTSFFIFEASLAFI